MVVLVSCKNEENPIKMKALECFGFKSGICLLIAPVPVHCFSITFTTFLLL